jgi:hypothetical protein
MRNRWYDPNTGQFTQQDPIGFAGGINLYAYAGNDPVTFSDPYGLSPEWAADGLDFEDSDAVGDDERGLVRRTLDWIRYKANKYGTKKRAIKMIFELVKELSRDPVQQPPPPPGPPPPQTPVPRPPSSSPPSGPPGGSPRPRIPGPGLILIPWTLYDIHKMHQRMTPGTPEWWETCFSTERCTE